MDRETRSEEPDVNNTVVIKKYANRRLYNTATSSYVTLQDLAEMVKKGVEFTVHDAKTGEEITRSVLTQIIVEQETKGNHLLPTSVLRQLIGYYDDNLQGLLPRYLEMTMQSFAHNQDQIREYLENALGGMYSFRSFEEMSRQNMALFEQAMSMMTPFGSLMDDARSSEPSEKTETADAPTMDTLEALKEQMDAMQRQIDNLSKPAKE